MMMRVYKQNILSSHYRSNIPVVSIWRIRCERGRRTKYIV